MVIVRAAKQDTPVSPEVRKRFKARQDERVADALLLASRQNGDGCEPEPHGRLAIDLNFGERDVSYGPIIQGRDQGDRQGSG